MACSFSAFVRLIPSWTRWKTSRSADGERLRYSTGRGKEKGRSIDVRVCVYGSVGRGEAEGKGKYVLHVISFEANICLSSVGISARDARVAVEVVYHHTFLVFGHRSVQEIHDIPINQTRVFTLHKKGVIQPIYRGCESFLFLFLGGTVRDVTIPVHRRTFVYSLSAVFHRRTVSFRSRLVDLLRSQRRRVGRSSCGRANR